MGTIDTANKLKDFQEKTSGTLLGICPMSIEIVDSVIDYANLYRIPFMLVASRRQVDSEEFGRGYVNNWTTNEFAEYVRSKDVGNYIAICRDHGGPWQNNLEIKKKLSLEEAMTSAKGSFKADIEAGFDILHIDPSVDPTAKPSLKKILDRVFELYSHCIDTANILNRKVAFEIGTEEQSGKINTPKRFESFVKKTIDFCDGENYQKPLYIVGR